MQNSNKHNVPGFSLGRFSNEFTTKNVPFNLKNFNEIHIRLFTQIEEGFMKKVANTEINATMNMRRDKELNETNVRICYDS